MPSVIILDTGPLSCCVVSPVLSGRSPSLSQECRQWVVECEQQGSLVLVPAIAFYETLRELERRNAGRKIDRLKRFSFQQDRFIPLTTAHLELAARLWGISRNEGFPTAADDALDGDVILAAQVQSLGLSPAEYVVATSNTGHLSRFVTAADWRTIIPER